MRVTTNRQPGTAVSRATRIWGECALFTRGEVRKTRGRGPLKTLDEIASGRRGASVPKGLAMFAMELSAAGVPPDQITAQLQQTVARMVEAVCVSQDPPRSA